MFGPINTLTFIRMYCKVEKKIPNELFGASQSDLDLPTSMSMIIFGGWRGSRLPT